MSRRRRVRKRRNESDPLYGSLTLERFINKIMLDGKKAKVRRIVYMALDAFAQEVGVENPLIAFEQALENAKPLLEVKSRRIGGATYQVPVEIPSDRRLSLAMRWMIINARTKPGRSMQAGLFMELCDCYRNQGATIKKRDETHRMAEANRAFAHYKW